MTIDFFEHMRRIEEEMDAFFTSVQRETIPKKRLIAHSLQEMQTSHTSRKQNPVSVMETETKVIVTLPLHQEIQQVNLAVADNILTLHLQIKHEEKMQEKNKHAYQLSLQQMKQSVTLPAAVDAAKAIATSREGILCIELPKREVYDESDE